MNLNQKKIVKPTKAKEVKATPKSPLVLKFKKADKKVETKSTELPSTVKITPIIDKKNVKTCNGSFSFNTNYKKGKEAILIEKGTVIEGTVAKGDLQAETLRQIDKDMKYSESNSFFSIKFDDDTHKYTITFLKDTFMLPARIAKYIKGYIHNGWLSFEDSEGKLINKYLKYQ